MVRYCESCKELHDENDLCPKYKEQLKQHPEWFNEMTQMMATASIASPAVQRYGSAIKERLVAYSGVDNETGQQLTRSLKSLSQQQTHPDYEYQNLKQRAGFAAEVQETAEINAERAIKGESGRVVRYDDIGTANHPLYDLIEVDANGTAINGTGVQMKFIGGTAEECWNKVTSSKCQKYIDSNTPIKVPSDYYDKMLEVANQKIKDLNAQYQKLVAMGEYSKADAVKHRIEHCEKTKGLLEKSKITSEESMYAVKKPEGYTARQILEHANKAGLDAAKTGAIVGGSISILRNVVMLKNGEIRAETAVKNIAKDVASGAASGYVVGAGGSVLKGTMQNSKSATVRSLSATNFPAGAVSVAFGITKSGITNFIKYKNGELSKSESMRYFGKDAVKTTLVTCSLSMIAFPPGMVGMAATMGVAIYLDAACTNLLDEVFGEGLYEQLLHSSGHIVATAQNSVELLKQFKANSEKAEMHNKSSSQTLKSINEKEKRINDKISRLNDSLEGL